MGEDETPQRAQGGNGVRDEAIGVGGVHQVAGEQHDARASGTEVVGDLTRLNVLWRRLARVVRPPVGQGEVPAVVREAPGDPVPDADERPDAGDERRGPSPFLA